MVQKRKKRQSRAHIEECGVLIETLLYIYSQDEIHSFTSENFRVNTILYYMHKIEIFKCSLALKYTGTCSFNST